MYIINLLKYIILMASVIIVSILMIVTSVLHMHAVHSVISSFAYKYIMPYL